MTTTYARSARAPEAYYKLGLAFERMGFHTVHEIAIPPEIMPPAWSHVHLGLLGIRDTPREILPRDSRGTIGRPAEA